MSGFRKIQRLRPGLAFLFYLLSVSLSVCSEPLPLNNIKLPDGFKIEVFADNVGDARSMAWNGKNTLYVGTRRQGNVYALVDKNGDYKADQQHLVASGLNMPNGIAYLNGSLYVAEVQRILRYDNIDNNLVKPPKPVVLYDDLPVETHHGWRYMAFGPDNKLYISIGAPCNICDEPGHALIGRIDSDGNNFEVVARGVRNSVGFTWHPKTNELWFTDNGRDWLGDDLPPDELNRLTRLGLHFGFPYCHGGFFPDPDYGRGKNCNDYVAPIQKLGAHVASLGVHIYSGRQFPKPYQGVAFIAEHGSWNRSNKVGYRISMVRLNDNKSVGYETFAEGWLQGEKAWGRPVDIKPLPDGSLLVSDDVADAIYHISYSLTP